MFNLRKMTAKKAAIVATPVLLLLLIACWAKLLGDENGGLMKLFATDDDGDPLVLMPHNSKPDEPVVKVTAQELLAEFARDEDAARRKYCTTRNTWVSGTVTEISGPTVTLDGPAGVHCVYLSGAQLARLTIGKKATVEGNLKGARQGGGVTLFRRWKREP